MSPKSAICRTHSTVCGFSNVFHGFKYAIGVKKKNKTETVELAFEVLIMQPIDPSIRIIYFTVFFIFSPL